MYTAASRVRQGNEALSPAAALGQVEMNRTVDQQRPTVVLESSGKVVLRRTTLRPQIPARPCVPGRSHARKQRRSRLIGRRRQQRGRVACASGMPQLGETVRASALGPTSVMEGFDP